MITDTTCYHDIQTTVFLRRVQNFDQSEARKQCFLASKRLKFGTLPQPKILYSMDKTSLLENFPKFPFPGSGEVQSERLKEILDLEFQPTSGY